METKIRNHLWDIRNAAKLILDSTAEVSFVQYEEDEMLRSAVERQFEIIGEATRRLANDDRSIAEKITGYQTIIGLRNRLAHESYPASHPTV